MCSLVIFFSWLEKETKLYCRGLGPSAKHHMNEKQNERKPSTGFMGVLYQLFAIWLQNNKGRKKTPRMKNNRCRKWLNLPLM